MHDWFYGEHITWNRAFANVKFNQLIFAGDDTGVTTTTYALATWRNPFAGVAPTGGPVRIRICDFYRFDGERISHNWMMLDVADMMRSAGRRVVPKATALPDEGTFLPPRAMDGLPAPISAFVVSGASDASRAVAAKLLESEWKGSGDTRALWHEDMLFYGPSGVGLAKGYDQYHAHVLRPLWAAFAERRFDLDSLVCEGAFCGAHGYLVGTHVGCYLGQHPRLDASAAEVRVRVGMHWHISDGKALDGYAFYDAPAFFNQFGVDVFVRANDPANHPLPTACPPVAEELVVTTTAAAVLKEPHDSKPRFNVETMLKSFNFVCALVAAAIAAVGLLLGGRACTATSIKRTPLAAPLLET